MEIQKQGEILEHKWKDITFRVRAQATAGDRFEIDILYDVDKGVVVVPRRELYRTLIKRFVVGWEGVTEDGKPVPFSLENLERLPADNEDVILFLGSFIVNKSGLFPAAEESSEKKG